MRIKNIGGLRPVVFSYKKQGKKAANYGFTDAWFQTGEQTKLVTWREYFCCDNVHFSDGKWQKTIERQQTLRYYDYEKVGKERVAKSNEGWQSCLMVWQL